MSNSRIPSPARSQGAPVTPRRYKSRTRSVGSPARSTTSERLSALVQFKENNKDSFVLSPAPSRRSVLNDDTHIEEPRRISWWKKLADNSRDVMEVLNDNKILEANEAVEEYIDIEVLSQEKKNYSIDIPDSSDSESISSIVIPQRKLFTQKDLPPNKFGQLIGKRETLAKLHQSQAADKSVHVAPKNLFGQGSKPRTKPVFPAALLTISPNKTVNKTKENVAAEVKGQVRNLFGNRAGTKRKNMFADFIVSDSEDEISEIQPRVFEFPKKPETRRESGNSRGKREHSPTSSITTDIEMDEWKMLPSSTMVENQLEDIMASGKTPVKRPRLSNLPDIKEYETKTSADPTEKEPSEEEQELKYSDDDKSEHSEPNLHQDPPEIEELQIEEADNKETTLVKNKTSHKDKQIEHLENEKNVSKRKESILNKSKVSNISQQKHNISNKKDTNKQNATQEKPVIQEEAMEVEEEQEQNNESKEHVESRNLKELQMSIEHNENKLPQTEQLVNVNKTKENINNITQKTQHDDILDKDKVAENDIEDKNQSLKNNEAVIEPLDDINNKSQKLNTTESDSKNKNKAVVEEKLQKKDEIVQENSLVENVNEMNDQEDSDNEDQNEEEDNKNESEVNEQNGDSEEEIANDEEESVADQNVSEANNESEIQDNDEGVDKSHNVSAADAQNESAAEIQESDQEIQEEEVQESDREEIEAKTDSEVENDDEQNESEEDNDDEQNESEVDNDNDQNKSEVDNDDDQNEIDVENDDNENRSEAEMQDVSAEVQDDSDNEQNDSNEEQDEMDVTQNETAEADDVQNESSEIQEDMDDEPQNESEIQESEEEAQNESQEDNQEEEESDNEIQDSNDQPQSGNDESPNVTHDTTGRHRKKNETEVNSPEAIRHDNTNELESFTAQGRNTSIRKTTMLKNLAIRPSLAPPRESTGLSDGTRNSSAEGSGWDSHRTTRKTLRQTFGRDFTPRKSLRALVMEKSAKRQTAVNDLTAVTSKFPQANSTELPEASMAPDDDVEISKESNHDVSKRTRQTTLEMYLQKIKKQNLERKLKTEEAVRNSLQAPSRDVLNPFKKPLFSSRKPGKVASKPKAKPVKPTLIPLDDLPEEVIEDMKYKPPKRFQPSNASWITKRLYKFLESKLESQYDYKARVRAEKLVESLYYFCKDLRRHDAAAPPAVDALKHEMARLNVVRTHFDFYQFFHEFMPREIRVKVVPDLVNKINMPRHGVFSDIIRGNTVQG